MGKRRIQKQKIVLFTMQSSTHKKRVHDYNFMLISIAVQHQRKEENHSENKPVPEKKTSTTNVKMWIEERKIDNRNGWLCNFGNVACRQRKKYSFATSPESLKSKNIYSKSVEETLKFTFHRDVPSVRFYFWL